MARAKRNREQRHRDLERMAEWRNEGLSERQIAARLQLSQSTVHRDLAEIDRLWLESIPEQITKLKRRQLGAVNYAISEAWQGFRESQRTTMRVTEYQERVPLQEQPAHALGDGNAVLTDEFVTTKRAVVTETGPGDPRWIKEISKLLDDRARLLGLYNESISIDVTRYLERTASEIGIDVDDLLREAQDVMDEEKLRMIERESNRG